MPGSTDSERHRAAPQTDELLVERGSDGILTLTLNRPTRLNAITAAMLGALSRELREADVDTGVKVVVITGAGRGFSSGLDLRDSAGGPAAYRLFDLHNSVPVVLYRMDKPVVCALNGVAAGGGMDLALGCDIRIASELATMGAVFTKRGIVPESGGCWYLPRLLGWAKAAEVALLGDVLDARQLLELGLVNRVVPHGELMAEAMKVARQIASRDAAAVQGTKRLMRLGRDQAFEASVNHAQLAGGVSRQE
jgi:enoyl-CoA hydratase/carnithine racemase